MRLFADVLGALEHHVLEEVCEARAPGALVQRPHVIPEIDGNQRQPVVLVRNYCQAVRQRVLLILDLGKLQLLRGRWNRSSENQKQGKGGGATSSQSTSHRSSISSGRLQNIHGVRCAP